MTIQVTLYDTHTLLGVMQEFAKVPSYWRDLAFPQVINFDSEYIDFEKIVENRLLAPLVMPTAQGMPIHQEASKVTRLKPAYVKPKDPVSPSRTIKRSAAGGGVLNMAMQTPLQRWNAIVADIMRVHMNAIARREEWMAARAILDGSVTLSGENYPERVVDFDRASNHTVVKTTGTFWGDVGVSIVDDINEWRDRVFKAKFGGATNRLTVGVDAWKVMRKDAELMAEMDTERRGTAADLQTGVLNVGEAVFVGTLGGGLEVWVYNDYYEDGNGNSIPFMDPRDVVLTGPNIMGHRCYGAILDVDAQLQAMSVFPKMWKQEDPSALYIMNQSAPLMVPVNPNNTLRARVVA